MAPPLLSQPAELPDGRRGGDLAPGLERLSNNGPDLLGDLGAKGVGVAVGGVGVPGGPTVFDFILCNLSRRVGCGLVFDAAFHAVDAVPAQPLDDRPGIRQIGVKAEEINTVSERENGRLIVQLKAQTADDGPYIPE